jgi:multicomponent Na+:H+ antiporter subunit G
MNGLALACMVIGALFFLAGTVGLLRFPDVHSRLHALTKADNVGLGFLLLGLALEAGSPAVAAKLFVTWCLVLLASASVSHVIARAALRRGVEPWQR